MDSVPNGAATNGHGESADAPVVAFAPVEGDEFATIGEMLAAARAARGLELRDVADATRVRLDYLSAIEAMDPRRLPMGPYAAGFVRTYAAYLNIDPEGAAARFRKEMSPREPMRTPVLNAPEKRVRVPHRTLAIAIGLMVGSLAAWFGLQQQPGVGVDAIPPVPEALRDWVAAEPGAAEGARALAELEAAEGPVVTLVARIPAWLEVRGPSGAVLFSGELSAGRTYQAPQRAGLTVAARNGGAFEVMRDDESLGRIGRASVPVRSWSIDEARRMTAPTAVAEVVPEEIPPPPVAEPAPVVREVLPESRILTSPPPSSIFEEFNRGGGESDISEPEVLPPLIFAPTLDAEPASSDAGETGEG